MGGNRKARIGALIASNTVFFPFCLLLLHWLGWYCSECQGLPARFESVPLPPQLALRQCDLSIGIGDVVSKIGIVAACPEELTVVVKSLAEQPGAEGL